MSDNSLEAVTGGDTVDNIIDNAISEVEAETTPETQEPSEPVEDVKVETEEAEAEEVQEEAGDDTTEEVSEPEVNEEVEAVKIGMQKRIDRQTAANRELQEQMQQLQEQVQSMTSQTQEAETASVAEPDIEDYDSVDDYKEAMLEYSKTLAKQEAKLEMDKLKQAEFAQKQQAELLEMQDKFNERENAFRETVPDYDERVQMFDELSNDMVRRHGVTPAGQAIAQVLLESESAPRLIYELAGNPEKAEALMQLSPVGAAFELFKMTYGQKKLADVSKPKATKPAPAPIKGLKPTGQSSKGLGDLSGANLLKEIGVR